MPPRLYSGLQVAQIQIISVNPSTRTLEGQFNDGGVISVSLTDVPTTFRWPKEGEIWSVQRDSANAIMWRLGSRLPGQTSYVMGTQRYLSYVEDFPIENMAPGEARIDAEAIFDAVGRRLLREGDVVAASGTGTGTPELYVQPTAPANPTPPYLWIQTNLPAGGWTLWFDDGS